MRSITFLGLAALLMMACIACAESIAEPENISFSGDGQEASQEFFLDEGLSIFSMKHSGSSNFIVWLLDSSGNKVDLLANEVGDFDGAKAVGISQTDDYVLDTDADGPWMVDIRQPRPQIAQSVPISFSGTGQQVPQLFELGQGLARFEMEHDGERNFAIWLLDSTGKKVDLLVNKIGPFDGSKATGIEDSGIYCLDISADGNWRINISQ